MDPTGLSSPVAQFAMLGGLVVMLVLGIRAWRDHGRRFGGKDESDPDGNNGAPGGKKDWWDD